MSKVTSLYNAMIEQIAIKFPTKSRIPDPYNLENNNKQFLQDGYGIAVGGSSHVVHDFNSMVIAQQMTVKIVRELIRTESDTALLDDGTLALLEDVYQIQKLFYSYEELDIEAEILQIELGETTPISTTTVDKQNSLVKEVNFTIHLRENL